MGDRKEISSITESALCESCKRFWDGSSTAWIDSEGSLSEIIYGQDEALANRRSKARQCLFTYELKDIFDHAKSQSCHMCVMICAKFRTHNRYGQQFRELERQYQANDGTRHEVRTAVVENFMDHFYIHMEVGFTGEPPLATDQLWTVTEVTASMVGVGQSLEPSTSSQSSLDLAKMWLKECMDNHPECKALKAYPESLPKRLLDIEEWQANGKIKVHSTEPTKEYQYLTLSYSWGGKIWPVLNDETEKKFQNGIPAKDLALNFQHAIEVTWRLGYRYLWIDALCIMQPPHSDWKDEAVKMAGIYGNAVCSIAAAASAKATLGCYRERVPLEVQPLRFNQYPFKSQWDPPIDTAKPFLVATQDIAHAWEFCKGPLDTRGWVLQEELLAPRTLHFGPNQLFWECRRTTSSEVWPSGIPLDLLAPLSDGKAKTVFDKTKLLASEDSSGFDGNDLDFLYWRWEQIAEMYSARDLSHFEDKLPALSGLAQVMSSLTNDKYLAGLWTKDLLRGLAWYATPGQVKKRPVKSRTPSWSWTSIDNAVKFSDVFKHSKDMESTILDASVDLESDKAPTGLVTGGKLVIQALTRPSTWHEDHEGESGMKLVDQVSNGWLDSVVRVFPDTDVSELPASVYLCHLYRSTRRAKVFSAWGGIVLHGLVLSLVEGSQHTYRRLGYWKAVSEPRSPLTANDGWTKLIEGWQPQTLTVI